MSTSTIFEAIAASPSSDGAAILALGREPLSYSQLVEQLSKTVRALNAFGVGRNDRVAVVLPNGTEMATACLAVAAGATCAPLNPEYKQEEFEYFLPILDAKALIVQAGVASAARDVARGLGIPILELSAKPEQEAGRFDLASQDEAAVRRVDASLEGLARPEDTALVLHTSGTTARPKIVGLT